MDWIIDKNRPICPQICEQLCLRLAAGQYAPNGKIPSVREIAVAAGVNPNTVMRSYERLEVDGVIFNRRGIGFFVSEGAKEHIRQLERQKFMDEELPKLRERLQLLGLTIDVGVKE